MKASLIVGLSFLVLVLSGCAVQPGPVTSTNNPQVALYTLTPPAASTVWIEFGTTTNYGMRTGAKSSRGAGDSMSFYVAGMRSFTTYHMRAVVQLPDGTKLHDTDHTFTTGGLAPTQLPAITTATTPGMTPQPGIEMLNPIDFGKAQALATDLKGNVIWFYTYAGSDDNIIDPIRPMANGDFLVQLSFSPAKNGTPIPPGTVQGDREIDLAGNTIKEITLKMLNAKLAQAGIDILLQGLHHDIITLPNGHWIMLGNTVKTVTNFPGFPGTIGILGDVIIDLDTNLNPVWTWNSFQHLDINRHPMSFPDWTHSNALLYSDDGNLLLSMRHQNWIIKIDYENGTGSGKIIWHLGEGGDFKLSGGTDPTDWFYAQHGPSFASANSSGQFSLAVFDNGNDRAFPAGVACATPANPFCQYSTGEILEINESAKTANLAFHYFPDVFSFFGGNAELLANGNVELDFCDPGPVSDVDELTNQPNPQIVWQMKVGGDPLYRAFRMPSLYPGVQW